MLADEAGENVDIQGACSAGFEEVPGHGGHGGIVGAELSRGDPEVDLPAGAHLLKPFAEARVGCDAAADAEGFVTDLLERLFAFADEDVDDGFLETGGEVGDAVGS